MFGRATITLGIGPHSRLLLFLKHKCSVHLATWQGMATTANEITVINVLTQLVTGRATSATHPQTFSSGTSAGRMERIGPGWPRKLPLKHRWWWWWSWSHNSHANILHNTVSTWTWCIQSKNQAYWHFEFACVPSMPLMCSDCQYARRYVVIAIKPMYWLQQCTTRGHSYHSPKLHPGPCSSVRRRRGTDTQTDAGTRMTTIHFV